jgi:DNA polymerase-3 subunit gamma/tau
MSYIVFARKYRPQAFDEIVGQSHITTTLKNAIIQNKVAHAYIFAGPRGVGKTTTARILAKALNCEKGPTDDPCNKCASCAEITQGSSLDILEIDGASNRGIDEIRNLRENVKFSPSKGRFKVYIIDEVHMLTPEAFNALLKTLEEPPAHVKFIFATTQAHKVPPTILSRCQRFDFRRIAVKDIVSSLKDIARKEGMKLDDEALIMVAKHSDGSMRDAQVVLDQISSFAEDSIGAADVSKVLGAVGDDTLFDLAACIKDKDAVRALKIVENAADDGKDIVQLILCLIEHFRNLSVMKVSKDPALIIDASAEKIKRYEEQAKRFNLEEILYAVYTLSNTIDFVRKSNSSRVPLEVALVKLTLKGPIMPSQDLIERLERLEGASAAAVPPAGRQSPQGPQPPEAKMIHKTNELAGPGNIDYIISAWPAVINRVKERKISVAMYLKEGMPFGVDSNTLTIEFPKQSQFHKEMLDTPECKSLIALAVKDVCGADMRIRFTLSESANGAPTNHRGAGDDTRTREAAEDPSASAGARPAVSSDDPLINDAIELFGGEIRGGRPRPGRKEPA